MIRTLVALFVRRMLAPEADDTADAGSRLAAFGAVAMGPGLLVAATGWVRAVMYVFLGEPDPEAYAAAVAGDRRLLLALALGASGLATASLLDSLFPDERDHACLGPLPLPSRLVLGSRLAALLVPALLVAAAASLPPGLLHALAVTTGGAPEGFLRHAASLVSSLAAASLTAFLVVAGTGGLLLLLPRGVARTLAAPVQAFLVVGSVLQPLPAFARRAAVPFVGLHATFLGPATPVDLDAARGAGLVATLAAAALLAGFAASARRYATGDFGPAAAARPGALSRPISALLARAGRSGPERQALRLIVPTLARSGRHRRTVLTLAAGGAALAYPGLVSPLATAGPLPLQPALTALFLVSFALLVALRAAFAMPIAARSFETLRAMGGDELCAPTLAVRALVSTLVLPLSVVAGLGAGSTRGAVVGLGVAGSHALLGTGLAWLLGRSFGRAPFAPGALPGGEPAASLGVWLLLAGLYCGALPALLTRGEALLAPLLLPAGIAAVLIALSRHGSGGTAGPTPHDVSLRLAE